MELTRGQQIIYVPNHADGQVEHPDCEKGFVTSVDGEHAFCRYWSKYPPFNLRTTVNSERAPIANLVMEDTIPQSEVMAALRRIDNW